MFLEKESLEQRFKGRLRTLFIIVFIALSGLCTLWELNQAKQSTLVQLESKYGLVENTFFDYLQRAEFELTTIAQLFSSSNLPKGKEIEALFSSHDAFLLGVIDFIYLKKSDGTSVEDPRGHLYLNDSVLLYSPFSKIGKWQIFSTGEGRYFLVFKKSMVSIEGKNLGYIYGFISLNNNFVFANSLLDSVNVDGVTLSTKQGSIIFDVKTSRLLSANPLRIYSEEIELSGQPSALELGVFLQEPNILSLDDVLGYKILLLALSFLAGYFIVLHLSRTSIFVPIIDSINDLSSTKNTRYQEFDDIEKIVNGKSASEAEQLRALQLLMESESIVVIFCDEVASVLRMNQEARHLFNDADSARTLFDFMPIISHSPIQQALKGEVGTNFNLRFSHVNKIIHWTLYPYIAESGFRGVALIGNDVTKETQLEWQLSQVQSVSLLAGKQFGCEELLTELNYLAGRNENSDNFPVGEWLSSLVFGFRGIEGVKNGVNDIRCTLGRLLCDELNRVPVDFYKRDDILIDCEIDSACVTYVWPREFRSLVTSVVMMIHSNELVEEKVIAFKIENQKLIISVTGISHSRPVFNTLVERLSEKIGARLDMENDQNFSIHLPYILTERDMVELPNDSCVIWVENGYERGSLVQSAFSKLNVEIINVRSPDDLFLQSEKLKRIDAVLVGCASCSDSDYKNLVHTMSMMFDRHNDLPIAMVGVNKALNEDDLFLEYYPFSYSFAELLISLFQLRPIIPEDMRVKGRNWLFLGGTKVAKAIIRSEFSDHDIVPHFIDDADSYTALLNNYNIEAVVALDNSGSNRFVSMRQEYPNVRMILTQNVELPINTEFFLITLPYDAPRIKEMIEFVSNKKSIN
ncbi:hypothetical protein O1D97_10445 [Marinomonas sp. 15G1-11]|uniref:Uncharacterized protein n=1 Tax=Marinomonas phaeophyticola TaxID=3004091 RepID=A0ABT4JUH5_9GAMM|nr:hypothetical protein [Marinomonas sp. 15G1-11]MCZ2722061.1 hypothetical protein [Marinomonas sp. 15G1-11]